MGCSSNEGGHSALRHLRGRRGAVLTANGPAKGGTSWTRPFYRRPPLMARAGSTATATSVVMIPSSRLMRGWQPLQAVMLRTLLDRAQARVDQRRDQCEALRRMSLGCCAWITPRSVADQAFQLHVRVTAEASAQRHETGLQARCATAWFEASTHKPRRRATSSSVRQA